MMKKVVALTGNSLLVHGLVSRLQEYSHVFELRVVDLGAPDVLQQISAFRPEIVIFEVGDLKEAKLPSLVDFLNSLPEVILLELRCDDPNVQLIQSVRFKASTADELVQLFKSGGGISTSAALR